MWLNDDPLRTRIYACPGRDPRLSQDSNYVSDVNDFTDVNDATDLIKVTDAGDVMDVTDATDGITANDVNIITDFSLYFLYVSDVMVVAMPPILERCCECHRFQQLSE